MDSGMYRLGSSISATLQQGAHTSSFYTQPDPTSERVSELRGGRGRTHVQTDSVRNLESKIDEAVNMMSGMQQLLLAQQATTQRLENSIAKMNAEVETLQADVKKISEEPVSIKAKSKRSRVPTELRVSSYHHEFPVFLKHSYYNIYIAEWCKENSC